MLTLLGGALELLLLLLLLLFEQETNMIEKSKIKPATLAILFFIISILQCESKNNHGHYHGRQRKIISEGCVHRMQT